jgi:hypothetical protein
MGKPAGCRICGKPLTFHQLVCNQLCNDWRCKNELLELEMAGHRDMAAADIGIDRPEGYPMVVVPDDLARSQRQPRERQQAHVNFLFDLCLKSVASRGAESGMQRQQLPADLEPPAEMASNVCRVCQGACCHLGKEEAFLDRAAIRRFIALSGICDPLEIVYAYFGYLPQTAVADACVYQTDRGCTLPRWMRADICNAYRCKGLRQTEQMIRGDGIRRLCVVVRRDNYITRSAFIRNRQIYPYPPREPGGVLSGDSASGNGASGKGAGGHPCAA